MSDFLDELLQASAVALGAVQQSAAAQREPLDSVRAQRQRIKQRAPRARHRRRWGQPRTLEVLRTGPDGGEAWPIDGTSRCGPDSRVPRAVDVSRRASFVRPLRPERPAASPPWTFLRYEGAQTRAPLHSRWVPRTENGLTYKLTRFGNLTNPSDPLQGAGGELCFPAAPGEFGKYLLNLKTRRQKGTRNGGLRRYVLDPTPLETNPSGCWVAVFDTEDDSIIYTFDLPETSAGELSADVAEWMKSLNTTIERERAQAEAARQRAEEDASHERAQEAERQRVATEYARQRASDLARQFAERKASNGNAAADGLLNGLVSCMASRTSIVGPLGVPVRRAYWL